MSFINISTNQQTSAQREYTERTPANLRNDFKVPIEIKKGDQMELLSLRLHLGTAIRIDEDVNDTLVWTWGNAPNWTQHVVQIPSGAYYDGFEIGKALTTSLNESTTIPSFDSSTYPQHRFNPTIEGGWTVTFALGAGGATDTYTIDNQQCTYMTDVTNGTIAQGHHGNNWRTGLTRLHSFTNTPFGEANAIEAFENLAASVTMRQSWISDIHEPNPVNTGAANVIDSLEDGDLEKEMEDNPHGSNLNGYLGRNFDNGQMNNVASFRAGDEAADNPSKCISSIYDNGGKVFCTTSPVWGFFLADFVDAAALVGPDVDLDIEMDLNGDDELEVTQQRTFVITKLAGAAAHNWDLRLDLKGGQAPFNPLMPGVAGSTFTRLYMHYIPEEGANVAVQESPFKNGSWAIGGYVNPGDPTGGNGVGAVPDDATDPDNWNFCTDTGIDPGVTAFGHRNVWYYDIISGTFQPGIQYDSMTDVEDRIRLDYTAHRDGERDTGADETPSLRPTAGGGFGLTMTRHLGYNPVRVGLNDVGAYVNSDYTRADGAVINAGTGGFGGASDIGYVGGGYESCRWQIQLYNDPDTVTLDGNGVLVPRLQVIGTENPETHPGANGFESKVMLETDAATAGVPALTPLTHDLVVCVEITSVQTLKFYCIQHPKYTLIDPNAPAGAGIGDKYQTDTTNTPTDAELQANLVYTLDNTGTQNATTDIAYMKESFYPLVPVVACGAGGYYAAMTLAPEQALWGDEMGSVNCWDMQLAYRDPAGAKGKNREIYEAFPDRSIDETVTIAPGATDPPTAIRGSGYCFKFGKLQSGQTGAPLNDDPTIANHYVTGTSSATAPYVNTVISELFNPNISNLQRILGFENLVQSTRNDPHFDPPLLSTRHINQMPLGDTFTVELTSSNVKGFNGGTGDVNRALAVINAEELEVDGDGGVIWASQTRRPVDLNVSQDTSFHSLNIQLRDANGKIMRTVEAPLDVVLYKSQPESAKMEQALRELREVIEGKKNDVRDVQLANIGVHNPLLGVIPGR